MEIKVSVLNRSSLYDSWIFLYSFPCAVQINVATTKLLLKIDRVRSGKSLVIFVEDVRSHTIAIKIVKLREVQCAMSHYICAAIRVMWQA